MLKCFRPLLNSMRVFGLYFTPSRRIHDVASRSAAETTDSEIPRNWNRGRIYATVMLVIVWLDTARSMSAFDKTDKFGIILLLKLAMITARLLSSVSQTACFVACQTGNLDRVFRDARLPKSDRIRYRRLAVVHSLICWFITAGEMLMLTVSLFLVQEAWDLSMTPLGVHIVVGGLPAHHPILVVLRLFVGLLYLVTYGAWIFSVSVNYIVTSRSYSVLNARRLIRPIPEHNMLQ